MMDSSWAMHPLIPSDKRHHQNLSRSQKIHLHISLVIMKNRRSQASTVGRLKSHLLVIRILLRVSRQVSASPSQSHLQVPANNANHDEHRWQCRDHTYNGCTKTNILRTFRHLLYIKLHRNSFVCYVLAKKAATESILNTSQSRNEQKRNSSTRVGQMQ